MNWIYANEKPPEKTGDYMVTIRRFEQNSDSNYADERIYIEKAHFNSKNAEWRCPGFDGPYAVTLTAADPKNEVYRKGLLLHFPDRRMD